MTDSNIEKFGEVFTPDQIINDLLDGIDYSDPSVKICEPSFGDGRILLKIKQKLLVNKINCLLGTRCLKVMRFVTNYHCSFITRNSELS